MKNPAAFKHDPFGRIDEVAAAAVTESLETREGRIATFARVAAELVESGKPHNVWVGSAINAWLEQGMHVGDLERHFLRVAGERGSHSTPAQILRRIRRS